MHVSLMRESSPRDLLWNVLRIHPEPCVYLDDKSVHEVLAGEPADYLAWIEGRLMDIAVGRCTIELPSKQIFSDGAGLGDFRLMPCVVRDERSVLKTVKLVGTNIVQRKVPDQITVGKAFCLDADENFVTHIIDACLLSSARTGACAAIAVKRLAAARSRVTIVGGGRVGFYCALYVAALGGVGEIVVQDARAERAEATVALLRTLVPAQIRCAHSAALPDRTDVLVLATNSATPMAAPEDVDAKFVVSVGADSESQRELPSAWAAGDVYVDTLDSVRVGDLRAWLAEGVITSDQIVDLLGVLRAGPSPSTGRPRIFISTGSALFDNLTIGYLLSRLRAAAEA